MEILLLIRSYNRPEYLETTLNSVLNSDLSLCKYKYIYDDCSNDITTINLLEYYKSSFNIIINDNNSGCKGSYCRALKYIKKKHNNILIITIDNDVIVKKDWITILSNVYKNVYKKYNNHDILLSGFNSSNSHQKIIEKYDIYNIKKSIGGVNFVFHYNFIDFILNNWNNNEDWGVVNKMNKRKFPIICLKESVVNHIGKHGLHSKETKFDTDYNFYLKN